MTDEEIKALGERARNICACNQCLHNSSGPSPCVRAVVMRWLLEHAPRPRPPKEWPTPSPTDLG